MMKSEPDVKVYNPTVVSVPPPGAFTAAVAPDTTTAGVTRRREPGKCCGCCCDYRLAVIVVNIIVMVLELIVIITLVAFGPAYATNCYDCGEEWVDHIRPAFIIEIIFSGISICLGILAIIGARRYNIYFVGAAGIWFIIGYIFGVIVVVTTCSAWNDKDTATYDSYYYSYEDTTCSINGLGLTVAGIAACLFAYPHFFFISEVRSGALSPTSENQQQLQAGSQPPTGGSYELSPTMTHAVPYGGNNFGYATPPATSVTTKTTYEADGSKKIDVITQHPDGSTTTETAIEMGAA